MRITIELYDDSPSLQDNYEGEMSRVFIQSYKILTDHLLEPNERLLQDSQSCVIGKIRVENDYE